MWVLQTALDTEWVDQLLLDEKYDLNEVKTFAKIFMAKFYPASFDYRVVSRLDMVMGDALPSQGLWRIQTKYKEYIAEDQRYFDSPGFGYWGDIIVMKADGYASYEEAFKALKDFDFEKYNPNFMWRIVQD